MDFLYQISDYLDIVLIVAVLFIAICWASLPTNHKGKRNGSR